MNFKFNYNHYPTGTKPLQMPYEELMEKIRAKKQEQTP